MLYGWLGDQTELNASADAWSISDYYMVDLMTVPLSTVGYSLLLKITERMLLTGSSLMTMVRRLRIRRRPSTVLLTTLIIRDV